VPAMKLLRAPEGHVFIVEAQRGIIYAIRGL
jgi:hypothetical protein